MQMQVMNSRLLYCYLLQTAPESLKLVGKGIAHPHHLLREARRVVMSEAGAKAAHAIPETDAPSKLLSIFSFPFFLPSLSTRGLPTTRSCAVRSTMQDTEYIESSSLLRPL